MYTVIFNEDAQKDVQMLRKHAPAALTKLAKLVDELKEHPKTGTGKVEQLKHYSEETWSRRITAEHRLVYRIHEDVVEVLVVSAYGHYQK